MAAIGRLIIAPPSIYSFGGMSAYKHALVVDEGASFRRLRLAAELLSNGRSVVVLDGVVALRATPSELLCEVVDATPSAHRCEEEYRVLIENAARALAQSSLSRFLPKKPLRWLVVDDYGTGTVQLWPAPNHGPSRLS